MNSYDIKQLRMAVSEYTKRSTYKGMAVFLIDSMIYIFSIAGVIFLETFALKVLCSIIAGLKISTLFVIAHDAAHSSLTNSTMLNKIIARLAFLPSYHNYSLWLIVHNKSHHQSTNLRDKNSWTPLSKDEYEKLPGWRKKVERFYRSPLGISFYYIVERWWKNKFIPYKNIVGRKKLSCWTDFLFAATYMIVYLFILIQAGKVLTHTGSLEMLALGFFIPLVISSFMIGFTVFQQHTHESIPWFISRNERDDIVKIEGITMHVKFPHWYNVISHNTMAHTVHHVDPRIPLYNLAKAQEVLSKLPGDGLTTINFSIKGFLSTMKKCKLYDYGNHLWLDFDGIPSSKLSLTGKDIDMNVNYSQAA